LGHEPHILDLIASDPHGYDFKWFNMPKFVPRQRKHKAREREKPNSIIEVTQSDSNAAEILPPSKSEREEKRTKLREELRAQQPNISSKKQKRLNKYIETKLKKDENAELIRKLAETKVDTSLFQSSKKLGRVTESKREILSRALREKAAGINVDEANAVLYEQVPERDESSSSEEDLKPSVQHATDKSFQSQVSFGSGLKRPLELDEDGNPLIKKRKRSKKSNAIRTLEAKEKVCDDNGDEDEWNGFSSASNVDLESHLPSNNTVKSTGLMTDSEDERSDSSEDQEEGTGESEDVGKDQTNKSKARSSAFKAWADEQRNRTFGFHPSNAITDTPILPQHIPIKYKPQPVEQDPLPPELETTTNGDRKAHAVQVTRPEEVQTARLALPVVAEEQKIMEAIFNNDVVIISGPTGSGKTTQVPQFLYEAGFGDQNGPTPGLIGVTQPRRVAAVSMAARVGQELGAAKSKVSHQIRFDTTVSRETAIKFMTDGVLLREISEDFTLKKYSAIVIDEAHERTVNTDVLIALMSRCIKARTRLATEKPNHYTPLKLIIMSATLRVSDFRDNSKLFPIPPPLIEVEGRQHEVTPHWSRKTTHSYVEEMFTKVSRGHRKLPPGGILVFLTGQSEIQTMARKLRETFGSTQDFQSRHLPLRIDPSEMPLEDEDLEVEIPATATSDQTVDAAEEGSDSDVEINIHDDPDDDFKIEGEKAANFAKVHVLPLYSQLPSKEQLKVFEPPPDGSRLIVLATNVAETSLTIPGIRYVFDSGRAKERQWDAAGVQTFVTTWISKASADQRMGRAGRTGPGHCYRLYSSAIYESLQDFAEPEIFRSPLEGVVLQLKSLGLPRVYNFPFPTPPDRQSLVKAEQLLAYLGALDGNGKITAVGKELQRYPLNPRFAQMLRLGQMHDCVDLTIAMVAALDVSEIFIPQSSIDHSLPNNDDVAIELDAEEDQDEAHRAAILKKYNSAHANASRLDRTSDAIKLLTILHDYSHEPASNQAPFSTSHFARPKALQEATHLRQHLHALLRTAQPRSLRYTPALPTPSPRQLALLKQIAAAGFVDQVAMRADALASPPPAPRKPRRAVDVPYAPLLRARERGGADGDGFVYLHPASVLARVAPAQLPRFVVYHALRRAAAEHGGKQKRVRMVPLGPVSAEQLVVLARGTTLLGVGKPIGKIGVLPAEGGCERREVDVVVSLEGGDGAVGWPLARKRVVQRRVAGEGWVVEKWID